MPFLQHGDASLYYEETGAGYPILVLAPGSLQSTIEAWHRSPWDPTKELADEYRVIAMDQRNAGQSRAPIRASDDWMTFLGDHLALLDHLGVERCHLMGACIGVSYNLALIQAQPQRFTAAVMQQPIGAITPRTESGGFDNWAKGLVDHPEATPEVLKAYHGNLYDPLFVYSVTRDFVQGCQTPMLILPGNDNAHPFEIAKQLHELAPNNEFIETWREPPEVRQQAFARVRSFLREHTPVAAKM